jgi:hypothetical protein
VKGEALNIPDGSTVQLLFNKKISKLKLDSEGKFIFKINLDNIYDLTENKIKVEVLKDGKHVESSSINVYCCSDYNFGYFQELIPNKSQVVAVKNINKELDGVTVTIPQGNIKSAANIFITIKRDASNISQNKYSPLSLPIAFDVTGNSHLSENVEYGLIAHFNEPRDGFADIAPPDHWGNRGNKWLPWKDAHLEKRKIVILGYNGDWKEIKPTKIDGNKIYFKLPKNHHFDRFLPAAILEND